MKSKPSSSSPPRCSCFCAHHLSPELALPNPSSTPWLQCYFQYQIRDIISPSCFKSFQHPSWCKVKIPTLTTLHIGFIIFWLPPALSAFGPFSSQYAVFFHLSIKQHAESSLSFKVQFNSLPLGHLPWPPCYLPLPLSAASLFGLCYYYDTFKISHYLSCTWPHSCQPTHIRCSGNALPSLFYYLFFPP